MGWALKRLLHLLFVEDGVEYFIHHYAEFARKDGWEFFKVFLGEVFISFYSF